ncbi:MAG: thiamine phosphate synthase [Cognatishimia sp.]|uniref:thiamine phosphate synthase n=1 Tax=Cognatishimia sp. TaxID=2211648 RepID=UPI003B8C18A1
MNLPRFYPVFDDIRWLERMVPLGVKLVQLRIKDTPMAEVKAQLQAGKELCAEHDAIMVVNDYWELAIELGCGWLHLGQEDLDAADLGAIRAAGLKLGVSTHDNAELDRVLAFEPEYVALGPVYPTILKKMKWHQQGLGRVSEWKSLLGDTPLCAIGGMSVERAPGAFESGADIVAAVTDITLKDDPEARVREWLEVCK